MTELTDVQKQQQQRQYDKNEYLSQLYTQLVINGLSATQAMERAKEAAELLDRHTELYFPTIVVG